MAAGNDETATAPLIGDNEEQEVNDDESTEPSEQELTSPSSFTWALTFAAAISGLLFGYESVSPSSHLTQLNQFQHWSHLLHSGIHRSRPGPTVDYT